MKPQILKAFNDGGEITVRCINRSVVPFKQWQAGQSFSKLINALQTWAQLFARFWGITCKLEVANSLAPGCWGMVFSDDADVAQALGYHTTTPDGYPLMHNFVRTSILNNALVSVAASHELGEALADPCCNLAAFGPGNLVYAYEVCDPVQRETFKVQGIVMSDFVLPAWFESFPRQRYDYLERCKRPFEIRPGGYMPVYRRGKWEHVYGTALPDHIELSPLRRALQRGEPPQRSDSVTWDPNSPGPRPSAA